MAGFDSDAFDQDAFDPDAFDFGDGETPSEPAVIPSGAAVLINFRANPEVVAMRANPVVVEFR